MCARRFYHRGAQPKSNADSLPEICCENTLAGRAESRRHYSQNYDALAWYEFVSGLPKRHQLPPTGRGSEKCWKRRLEGPMLERFFESSCRLESARSLPGYVTGSRDHRLGCG